MFYIITDTHLGHEAFHKNGLRPTDYEEKIFRGWKSIVNIDDTVIHLGDIMGDDNFEMLESFLSLPGKKILVRGNHDSDFVVERFQGSSNFCCDELVMTFAGIKILFTHKPKYRHEYDINIHGHLHSLEIVSQKKLFLPLALEYMGYSPIPIDEKFLSNLKNLVEDFWLYGKIPSMAQFQKFGLQSPQNLKCVSQKVSATTAKLELLARRAQMEQFIESNFFDNYAMRNNTQELQNLFLHGEITFEDFKSKIENISGQKILGVV